MIFVNIMQGCGGDVLDQRISPIRGDHVEVIYIIGCFTKRGVISNMFGQTNNRPNVTKLPGNAFKSYVQPTA